MLGADRGGREPARRPAGQRRRAPADDRPPAGRRRLARRRRRARRCSISTRSTRSSRPRSRGSARSSGRRASSAAGGPRSAGSSGLARLDARISQNRLAARLRFIYDHGDTSTLELLLGARSLDDALDPARQCQPRRVREHDVLAQLTSAQHQLVRLSHSLALDARSPDRGDARACRARSSRWRRRGRSGRRTSTGSRAACLDAAQIARLGAQARAAAARSEQLQAAAATPPPSAARRPPRRLR